MTIRELKIELDVLGIKPDNYSLDGDLKLDAIILEDLKIAWNVFYLDERGNKKQERKFGIKNLK